MYARTVARKINLGKMGLSIINVNYIEIATRPYIDETKNNEYVLDL